MKKNKKKLELIHQINITPFTDVILVLLVIFMISAPNLILSNLKINLPKGNHSENLNTQLSEIIGIDKEGNLYYKNQMIQIMNLIEQLKSKNDENITILINADENTKHGRVVEVLNQLKENGFYKIYVGTSR